MDYNKIQGGLQKQMKKIDKTESSISKDLNSTKKGIKSLKQKNKGPGLLGLMLGGIAPIAFTIIGGLILITLARLAIKKWADTYMPPKASVGSDRKAMRTGSTSINPMVTPPKTSWSLPLLREKKKSMKKTTNRMQTR